MSTIAESTKIAADAIKMFNELEAGDASERQSNLHAVEL
jgi:hypothetical protein